MSTESAKATTAAAQEQQAATPMLDELISKGGMHTTDQKRRFQSDFQRILSEVVKDENLVAQDVEDMIALWMRQIDEKLSVQLNEVMHHPSFQKLEGTWRGMHYLVHQSETGEFLKLRVLNVTKDELLRDVRKAPEFDQSQLFKKVYEAEYGILGGTPYGLLVGDYDFYWHPEDVTLLQGIAGVAAAAHAPFISAASPKMFNLESFDELSAPRDLTKIFEGADYVKWRSFRQMDDARYVALTMPRVLARLPYGKQTRPVAEFDFEEKVNGKDLRSFTWMNSAWAYAARVTDAFVKDGWLARTRGVEGGGKVENLPVYVFHTDDGGKDVTCPSEIAITDRREMELSNLGFLPLLHCKGTDYCAFLGAQSVNKPKEFQGPQGAEATANAALSAKINYILCTSRFAHYLKVMCRNWVGKLMEREDVERRLDAWIKEYTVQGENIGEDIKAKRPLKEARVVVKEIKGRPGWYEAVAHLRPHFQLEAITMSLRLVANLPPKAG